MPRSRPIDALAPLLAYLGDPLQLAGVLALLAFAAFRLLIGRWPTTARTRSGRARALELARRHGYLPGVLAIAVGGFLQQSQPGEPSSEAVSRQPGVVSEVDFGFVEAVHGERMPIPSYKHGGTMLLAAGDEIAYRVIAEPPVPPIEIRVGDHAHPLAGERGRVRIRGPAGEPLPATVFVRGTRPAALPGGAPPRVAVNICVYGIR